ncbi:Mlp family lipoprotein [Borreliella bavariensis]|uniref:Mlp family lipoprotein n=1 Tax=Borreliella bavariensis TaxID=664662 RepID=UPI001C008E4A|nr:Mlp family lipoprotein [Borreliella bavariensis]
MKIINILFCLFLIMLNGCNSNDNKTLKKNAQQSKSRQKRDLEQKEEVPQEKPKSKEELLREKLSKDQKIHLDWLKTALTNAGEFDIFLQYDVSKIKTALDHIKTELDKCRGKQNAAQQENTFKQIVQGALSGGDIDRFPEQASSLCDILP